MMSATDINKSDDIMTIGNRTQPICLTSGVVDARTEVAPEKKKNLVEDIVKLTNMGFLPAGGCTVFVIVINRMATEHDRAPVNHR